MDSFASSNPRVTKPQYQPQCPGPDRQVSFPVQDHFTFDFTGSQATCDKNFLTKIGFAPHTPSAIPTNCTMAGRIVCCKATARRTQSLLF